MSDRVIITGGQGALGQALAAAFSASHAVDAPGHEVLDVTRPEQVRAYFVHRVVDLLVCNAGITRDAPLARLTEAQWDETVAVNLTGAAACAAAVMPGMAARGRGHIVFLSSFSALHPPAGQAAYAAAKAGLLGLATSLAREAGPQGVRVNTVLPGFMETPMTAAVSAERKAAVKRDHLLERFNTPAAAAEFILHLHERLPHTSGQVFQLDSRIA